MEERPPYEAYAAIMGVFFGGLAATGLLARPWREMSREVDPRDLRHPEAVRFPRHHGGDLEPARPDAEHPHRARLARVAVAAEHRLPRRVVPLHVAPVTDPVPGAGEERAISGRHPLQEQVVVRVLEARLQDVVVHVLGRALHADPVHPHLFELEPREGARRVLEEGLVHPDPDLLPGDHPSVREMLLDHLVGKGLRHVTAALRKGRRRLRFTSFPCESAAND